MNIVPDGHANGDIVAARRKDAASWHPSNDIPKETKQRKRASKHQGSKGLNKLLLDWRIDDGCREYK